ncbi:gonadotropin-releasing hormone receptor-like [Apostichopus japonicus]
MEEGKSASYFYTAMPPMESFSYVRIYLLAVMIIASTIGNVSTLLISLQLRRRRKSSVVLLILHLAITDLLVTYLHMVPHLVWYSTEQWYGGDFLCKAAKFFSSFGLFCSSFMTVNISLDHCLAVFNPLAKRHRPRQAKMMIISSYVMGAIFSIPQIFMFEETLLPGFSFRFTQCLGIYPILYQTVYSIIVVVLQVLLPLIIMWIAYIAIFLKIRKEAYRGSKPSEDNPKGGRNARSRLFFRAQYRTLRMIVTIFLTFVINWTPYLIGTLVYLLSSETAEQQVFYELLFLFGLSNSCFNPIVYGACNLHYCDSDCSCCLKMMKTPNEWSQSGSDRKTSMFTLKWTRGNNRNQNQNSSRKRVNFNDRSLYKNSVRMIPVNTGNTGSNRMATHYV